MPGYNAPPEQWFARELAALKLAVAAGRAQTTQYVTEPDGTCRAIIGNLAVDQNGNSTGLSGWGIASFTPGDLVSALPGSPHDGQIVGFQNAAMAAEGVVWRLRYRAASSSSHKWEFIGGSRLQTSGGQGAGVEIETNGSGKVEQAAPETPTLTVPLTGVYSVVGKVFRLQYQSATAVTGLSLYVGPSAGSAAFLGSWAPINQYGETGVDQEGDPQGLNAGDTLRLYVAGDAGKKWVLQYSRISIQPITVG